MLNQQRVKLTRYPVETSTPAQSSLIESGSKLRWTSPSKARIVDTITIAPITQSPDQGIILVPRVRVRQWRDAWKHRDTIYLPPVAARSESNERQNASIYPRSSRISAVQSPPPRTKGAQPACERVRLTNDPTRPRARSITRLV